MMQVSAWLLGPWLRAGGPAIAAAAILALGGVTWSRWLAHVTFLAMLSALGVLTVERVFGVWPALGLGAAVVLLTGVLAFGPLPQTTVGPLGWSAGFTTDDAVVQHVMRLPMQTPRWSEAWDRAAAGYIRACLDPPTPQGDPGVRLSVNGIVLPPLMPEKEECQNGRWYRTPVSRSLLESAPRTVVELRPAEGGLREVGAVMGGYSFRPTAGPQASRYFDGQRWHTSDLSLSLDGVQSGRYLIELWLVDQHDWVVMTWY